MGKMLFQVVSGRVKMLGEHAIGDSKPISVVAKEYGPGDIFESSVDLEARHGSHKYRRVDGRSGASRAKSRAADVATQPQPQQPQHPQQPPLVPPDSVPPGDSVAPRSPSESEAALETMNVDELRDMARAHELDLTNIDTRKRADLLRVLREAGF